VEGFWRPVFEARGGTILIVAAVFRQKDTLLAEGVTAGAERLVWRRP